MSLIGVGGVKLRLNRETAAIEMMPLRGTEWEAAAVELVVTAGFSGNHMRGTEIDPDLVPIRGAPRPRKDAMQVLAELFAKLVESPDARC